MYFRYTAEDTYYSHGFIVPFVTGFLIWQNKDILEKIPKSYSLWGLVLIFGALVLHLISIIFYFYFSSGISIFILIIGITLFLFGKDIMKSIIFPISFLIFMFPLPTGLINIISYPLKMNVASMGSKLANLVGVPSFQAGFFIETSKGTLLIDNPCSGLRSLIAFTALGSLIAYSSRAAMEKRVTLFALSIPVALLTNVLRVLLLICVASYYGVDAVTPDKIVHNLSGYVVFVAGGVVLLGISRLFEWKN